MYKYESSDFGWAVCSASAAGKSIETVDHLRTRSAAELAARELSAGRAHVERHRPVGCRVQPGPAF